MAGSGQPERLCLCFVPPCLRHAATQAMREADKGKIMFVQLNDGSTPLDIQAASIRHHSVLMRDSCSAQDSFGLQVVIDSGAKGFDSPSPGSRETLSLAMPCIASGLKGKVGTGASMKCTGEARPQPLCSVVPVSLQRLSPHPVESKQLRCW